MDSDYILQLVLRWLHILAACVAVGVPIYMRLALMPALAELDEVSREKVRAASARRWRVVVYIAIVIFLATGLYNFLVFARWKKLEGADRSLYHMIFGIKFLLAFGLFFLASAVVGRSARLAMFRANAKMWVTVIIVLGLVIVGLSGALRLIVPAVPA